MSRKFPYTQKFQVRTAGGRLIASGCSIEHVEPTANQGRSRDVWVWDDRRGAYRHYRSY